jgi:hypothetical protein
MLAKLRRHIVQIYFVTALLCLSFVYGVAVGEFQFFPFGFLQAAWMTGKHLLDTTPSHLSRAKHEGEGVVTWDRDATWPGATLLTSPWNPEDEDWYHGIRLISLGGDLLHEWRADPRTIWPANPHDDFGGDSKHDKRKTYIHGALLMPGGDVVYNFEHLGLVRLNARSEVVWKLDYRTHHSAFLDDQGAIWVCGAKWHESPVPRFHGLRPPFVEETMLQVSPQGKILREISILESMYGSGLQGLFFFERPYNAGEVTHMNDVEILGEADADAFDLFAAGDIVVSLRDINTVLVVDGKTELVKWHLTHPFVGQHDPDFTPDGFITVFDNNIDRSQPHSGPGGSRILRVDPSTKEVTVLYGEGPDQYFYTRGGGKHQHLPNGNILITESQAGRVFETTRQGQIVWSWVTPRWEQDSIAEIMEGSRYGGQMLSFLDSTRED